MEENKAIVKKLFLIFTTILVIVMFIFYGLISLFKYYRDEKLLFIASSVSPDSKYELVLHQKGAWTSISPFGPSNVKISLKEKETKKTVEEIYSSISNDGATLHEHNWSVVWYKEKAVVTLHGCEQEDKTYTVHFDME